MERRSRRLAKMDPVDYAEEVEEDQVESEDEVVTDEFDANILVYKAALTTHRAMNLCSLLLKYVSFLTGSALVVRAFMMS
jgi:hypothetical protein